MMFNKIFRRAKEEGFTLVELMIVVGILALLSAIALPIYLNGQREAAKSTLRTDISNTAIAVGTYTAGAVEGKQQPLTEELFETFKNQSSNNVITYEEYVRPNGKKEYCIQGQADFFGEIININYNLTTKEYVDDVCEASGK
jgi:prepilin-type N-terminal cleavage/methylation domain-containing protein